MENKKIIIGLLILAVLLVGFIFFFRANLEGFSLSNNNEEETVTEINFNLDNSYLYKAGEDGQQGARNAAVKVDQFKVGDFLAIAGYYSSNGQGFAAAHILDNEKNIIQQDIISFTINEGENKNFDACCSQVPSNPGSYYLTIDIEEESTEFLLPFEVTSN